LNVGIKIELFVASDYTNPGSTIFKTSIATSENMILMIKYKLKRCAKKECCKQFKFKGTMAKGPEQKQHTEHHKKTCRTSKGNRHLEKTIIFGVFFFNLKIIFS